MVKNEQLNFTAKFEQHKTCKQRTAKIATKNSHGEGKEERSQNF